MFSRKLLLLNLFLLGTVCAWNAPDYNGFGKLWQDTFDGPGGSLPDEGTWNIVDGYLNVNAELEVYTRSTRNVQRSGGSTVQLVPWRESSVFTGWTSGRLESKYVFTPQSWKITRAEAFLRFGNNPIENKQGIWPAFWTLGNALRNGGSWPACGELDVLETVNGQLIGHGTAHCDVYPGGRCNEGNGIGASIGIPDQSWHTWRIEFDRTKGNWQQETITWFMDGQQFHQISGSRIGDEGVWNTLCHRPFYFILNVAVGGSWVGRRSVRSQC